MKKWMFKLFLAVSLIGALHAQADETPTPYTFLLPVNWVVPNKINLKVTIPDNFVPVQPIDTWAKAPFIEFIPRGEDVNGWSQIITINKFIGQGISAIDLADQIVKGLLAKAANGEVVDDSNSDEKSYKTAKFSLVYFFNDKKEVLGARYFSGPFDCAGAQLTVRPEQDVSDAKTIETVNAFFDKNVMIFEN